MYTLQKTDAITRSERCCIRLARDGAPLRSARAPGLRPAECSAPVSGSTDLGLLTRRRSVDGFITEMRLRRAVWKSPHCVSKVNLNESNTKQEPTHSLCLTRCISDEYNDVQASTFTTERSSMKQL